MKNYIGNKNTLFMLKLAQHSVKGVYIFEGPKGVGKFSISKEFTKGILCFNKVPNCTCESCLKVESLNHPDIKIFKPEGKSIKINTIREIIKETHTAPLLSKYKVYIIDDADKMTIDAQNAFLNTLEGSQFYNIFILIAHSKLLPTIQSRSQKFNFTPVSYKDTLDYLNKLNLEDSTKEILLACGKGRIGKINLLIENKEFLSFCNDFINILKNIPFTDEYVTLQKLHILKEKDTKCFFDVNKDFLEDILNIMSEFYMDIIKFHSTNKSNILFKSVDFQGLAKSYPYNKANKIVDLIIKRSSLLRSNLLVRDDFLTLISDIYNFTDC